MNQYNLLENALAKQRTAYDMMDIILTSIGVAKRCLGSVEKQAHINSDTSLKMSLKVVENDIRSIRDELANNISNDTDLLNKIKEEYNEHQS